MKLKNNFKAGDWVEVCSREEILRTLDDMGQLEGMPFMPEMFAFCGKRFRVYKSAHKTCDTVFPIRGRRVNQAVHLETRCDGSAHGGCQAGCLMFWKEAWLKPIESGAMENFVPVDSLAKDGRGVRCTESTVWSAAQRTDPQDGLSRYVCQATQLPFATGDLSPWDIRQYIEDYGSGNVTVGQLLKGLIYSAYYHLSQAGIGLGPPLRWLYEKLSWLWGGARFPRTSGTIPAGEPTPAAALNVQPGELVRVKSHEEILRTITVENKNRGMSWDAEMVPYCGGTYRVLKRVSQIVDERTGKMQKLKNPCIILDDVICQARYSGCRMFCPRSIYPYWREIWLERVSPERSSMIADRQTVLISASKLGDIAPRHEDEGEDRGETRGFIEIGSE